MLISARFSVALSITLLLAEAAPAASRFARIDQVDEGHFVVKKGTFDQLTAHYRNGKYREVLEVLHTLVTSPTVSTGAHQFDLDRNHYSFAFVTPNPVKTSELQLVRVFTYASGWARANTNGGAMDIDFGDAVLPGITTFYDVYLRTDASKIGTTCTYVEVESPLYADFLKFTKQIGIGQIMEYLVGGAQPTGPVGVEHVYFSVMRVTVPARRSNITLTSVVNPDQPEPIKNTTTYTNAPLRRASFGAVAAGMFTHGGDARVKISGDTIVADPLSGAMSVAAIYFHPVPYVAETAEPSLGERMRILLGYVATPEPGVALGGGFLLFRGVTLNVGYSYMLVNALPANAHVGDQVTTTRPFKRGYAGSLFAGFGYNFQ